MVIGDVGLDAARLRAVARAAGVTTGAVSHYFENKDAVLTAALAAIARRILDRQMGLGASVSAPTVEDVLDLACAFLPLDIQARREWRVWLAYWGRAIADDGLRVLHRDYYAAIVERLTDVLTAPGSIGAGLERDEASRLADAMVAALDGVGARATLEPETWPPERQCQTLALLLRPLFDTLGSPITRSDMNPP